jgi:ATP phosphoribosyltransferase
MRLAIGLDGRLLDAGLLDLLETAGLPVAALRAADRPSIVRVDDVEWLVTADADVAAVCRLGGADAGIVDKSELLERGADLAELLDLGTSRRRLVYAEPAPAGRAPRRRVRVATRFPATTQEHLAQSGREAEVIVMTACPWLAVGLGLAHGVVEFEDVLAVDAPEFEVGEAMVESSSRLVAGRQSRALHGDELAQLIDGLRRARGEA